MGERRYYTQENTKFGAAADNRGANFHFEAGGTYHATNCDKAADAFARSRRARDRRSRVAQGATAGFFAGGLTGSGIGAAVGAIVGSIVPGPGIYTCGSCSGCHHWRGHWCGDSWWSWSSNWCHSCSSYFARRLRPTYN